LRPQRCEDREAPIGSFAKDGVKPLSGFDDVLNRAALVIRSVLDTVPRRSDLGTLSTAPDTRYSPEFWMQRTDMHGGAAYRRPEHGELLAEHLEKPTSIGRKTSLLAQPAQKLGLAISKREIGSLGHISPDVFQGTSATISSCSALADRLEISCWQCHFGPSLRRATFQPEESNLARPEPRRQNP